MTPGANYCNFILTAADTPPLGTGARRGYDSVMARLLCIDNEPLLQQQLSLALQQAGYETHYAFTGPEGYQRAIALNPDLVIVDMDLPGMTGPELIEQLRRHPAARDMPIVAFSLRGQEALDDDNVHPLRKPVAVPEVLRLVRRVLLGRRDRTRPRLALRKGRVRVDPKFSSVWIDDRLVATLGPKRFQLLLELLQSPGEVERPRLVSRLWGKDGDENTLEKTVQRLREDLGADGQRVRTTRKGYELIGA